MTMAFVGAIPTPLRRVFVTSSPPPLLQAHSERAVVASRGGTYLSVESFVPWAPSAIHMRRVTRSRHHTLRMQTGDDGGKGKSPFSWKTLGVSLGLFAFVFTSLAPLFIAATSSNETLSKAELAQRLHAVPVFSITDTQGKPFLAELTSKERLGLFYLDPVEAEAQLRYVKSQGENDARVLPVALDDALRFTSRPLRSGETAASDVFKLKAKEREVQLAQQMTGKADLFGAESVPLFYLEGLAFKRDGARVFPLFFNYEELEGYVQQMRNQGAVDAKTLEASNVNIVDLNMVLRELASPQRNPLWSQVIFLPPQEGMQYVKEHAADK